MLSQLKLMILEYINQKDLKYRIIKDDNDLFIVDVFYDNNSTFKYTFILNKTTSRWNDCGFIGINEDEYRPMTIDGLNELFEIANICIKYGFCFRFYKNNEIVKNYQGVDKVINNADKTQVMNYIKQNKNLFSGDFDLIKYQNFKNDTQFDIKREELEKI